LWLRFIGKCWLIWRVRVWCLLSMLFYLFSFWIWSCPLSAVGWLFWLLYRRERSYSCMARTMLMSTCTCWESCWIPMGTEVLIGISVTLPYTRVLSPWIVFFFFFVEVEREWTSFLFKFPQTTSLMKLRKTSFGSGLTS